MGWAPATTAMPGGEDPAGFGFSDLMRVAGERARTIRNVALAVIGLALLVLLALPTLYSTSAVLMIDQRRNNIADQTAVLSALPTDQPSLQNQIQILTSRDLAAEVARNLDLYHDPEFARGGGLSDILAWLGLASRPSARSGELSQAQKDEVIDAFLSREQVDTAGMSTTLTVTYIARDPEKAARIANAIAETYIAYQLRIKDQVTRETTQWLNDRIRQLSQQVQAAEAAAQKYKADNNLNEAGDGTPLADQQLVAINAQIVQAKTDLAQKQATYARVKSLVDTGHAADVSQVVASPLIVQLRTQQADLVRQESDFTTRYGPRNPKLIAVQTQRRDLDAKIDQEVARLAGSIASDVAVARAQLGSLEDSLAQAEKVAAAQNQARVKLKALQANAVSTRTMYESFVTRLRETQDAIQMSDASILSRAPVPDSPSSPHRTLILAASIPAGLLLGLLCALLAERFESVGAPAAMPMPAIRMAAAAPAVAFQAPPTAVDPFHGTPILAEIPDAVPVRAASYVFDWPNSGYTQATANLLRDLVASGPRPRPRPRLVALTSAQPGEGATTIAVSLARLAAQAGLRVIVFDANFAHPSVAQTMGLNAIPAGIAEALAGTVALSRCMQRDPRSGALLLSAARPIADATPLATSPLLPQLVDHLKKACDLLIFDCAPVLTGGNARGLLRLADTRLVIVRDGPVRPAVSHAIGGLSSMAAPATGIVLLR